MGFRFRRSVSLFPGIRLNIGKTGIGVSAGIKGARVGVGSRGAYTSVGVPGTGVSMLNYMGKGKKRGPGKAPPSVQEMRVALLAFAGLFALIVVMAIVIVVVFGS